MSNTYCDLQLDSKRSVRLLSTPNFMAKKSFSSSKPKALSHGRPSLLSVTKPPRKVHLSSQTTRAVIRTHHNLLKAHTRAVAVGDTSAVKKLEQDIADNGGLVQYQAASILGQSQSRGGDTTKHLLDFLLPARVLLKQGLPISCSARSAEDHLRAETEHFRMLDVGALSTNTAASRSGIFDITRIDLNSQEKEILEQDFMKRPLPTTNVEKFDIVCLSLVVNYVPDAKGRGDMLKRVYHFLQSPLKYMSDHTQENDADTEKSLGTIFPALWLVLPAPCVTNSRYMTVDRLRDIMCSLGYIELQSKLSAKLAYFLFRWTGKPSNQPSFSKVEVKPGTSRNNFLIVT